MRKMTVLALLATPFLLAGCTTGYGADPLGGLLGSVLGGSGGYSNSGYGYGNNSGYGNTSQNSFQQAAIDACGQQASQYGRVSIGNVQQVSSNTLRVTGGASVNNYQQRGFYCDFRSDGRITNFGWT
ncbi:MAG: hypothetical protein ABIP41_06840 [Croceibacterium sp.]